MKVIADARGDRARGLHRGDRHRQPDRRARAERRDPHVRARRRRDLAGRRRRDRRRLRSRARARGGADEGGRSGRRDRSARASGRRGAARAPGARGPPTRAALLHGQRPDPALGVFDTVLVRDGRPVALERHLARLAASVAELYGAALPHARRRRRRRPRRSRRVGRRARLRIVADPDGAVRITVSPADPRRAQPWLLEPFALPGGLGAHKWRDRRLLDALSALTPARCRCSSTPTASCSRRPTPTSGSSRATS